MALAPMVNHNGKLIGDLTVAHLGPTPVLPKVHAPRRPVAPPRTPVTANDSSCSVRVSQHASTSAGSTRRSPPERTSPTRPWAGTSVDWPSRPAGANPLGRITTTDVSGEAFRFMDGASTSARFPFGADESRSPGTSGTSSGCRRAANEPPLVSSSVKAKTSASDSSVCTHSTRSGSVAGRGARVRPIYDPYEAGLDRFVKLDKGDFIGRDALAAAQAAGRTAATHLTVDTMARTVRMSSVTNPCGTTATSSAG